MVSIKLYIRNTAKITYRLCFAVGSLCDGWALRLGFIVQRLGFALGLYHVKVALQENVASRVKKANACEQAQGSGGRVQGTSFTAP